MADSGIASRRECEQMIVDGRVEINGEIVTRLPIFVNPNTDRIRVDGRFLSKEDTSAHRVYVMLNKPDNTLGTTKDELEYKKGGRRTVADLVKHHTGARLFPVGRLDFHSTGLVLMTNDGDLAERLTHARYGMTKTYRVWIHGAVPGEILDMLRRRVGKREAAGGGVRIITDDDLNQPSRQRRPQTPGNMTVLEIVAREGRTDPLGEMLVTAGCRVKRIARIAIGPLRLTGVSPGDWRDLTKDEVRTLKEAAGLYKPPTPPRLTHGGGRPTPDRRNTPETPMNPPDHASPSEGEADSPETDG